MEARGQKYSRQITVADYVLPKFHMDIQMPKEMLFSEGRFNINVTARYMLIIKVLIKIMNKITPYNNCNGKTRTNSTPGRYTTVYLLRYLLSVRIMILSN